MLKSEVTVLEKDYSMKNKTEKPYERILVHLPESGLAYEFGVTIKEKRAFVLYTIAK